MMRRWKIWMKMTVSKHYPATLPCIGWSGGDTTTTDQTITMDTTEEKIKQYIKAIHHLVQNNNDGMRILNEQLGIYNLAQQGKVEALQSEVEALQSEILLSKS